MTIVPSTVPRRPSPQALLLACLVALLALTVLASSAATATAEAAGKTCRHNLYLRSGISEVTVRRIPCRRAIRVLRTWVGNGMPRRGPAGWNCSFRRHGGPAPYARVACSRNAARMRFAIGG